MENEMHPQTIDRIKSSVTELGVAGIQSLQAFGHIARGHINWEETLYHMDRFGNGSLWIVTISATFIGMAISVQFGQQIVQNFGADILVGGFVSVAMFRELAPIFVAIVLTGNIAASITAEIGTMQVTDQVDALKVFDINPIAYLVVPRLLATAIVGPMLTIFGLFIALLAGQVFTELLVGIPASVFWDSVRVYTTMTEVQTLLSKSIVFSLCIAIIGSMNGLSVQGSSEAVGQKTTATVIWCLLFIFMLNYVITAIFFQIA